MFYKETAEGKTSAVIFLAIVLVLLVVLVLLILVVLVVLILLILIILLILVVHRDSLQLCTSRSYRTNTMPNISGFILGAENQTCCQSCNHSGCDATGCCF